MDYHDVLAELGVANAHPGGNQSTETWMTKVGLLPTTNVLDVGCGTGHTACRLAKSFGCSVTAVDIRPKMVAKTRDRARKMEVEVKANVASAEKLPFADDTFDAVITESVNVFLHPTKALREYVRVLKPGGCFVDVEMMTLLPVSAEWQSSAKRIYGVKHVPDLRGWKSLYKSVGFADIQVLASRNINPLENSEVNADHTGVSVASDGALGDPKVIQLIQENASWLEENYRTLGFGVFYCTKPVH